MPAPRLLRHLPFALAMVGTIVLAQDSKKLEPLPPVPPPTPEMQPFDAALEPQVTIKKRAGDTVQEYRINGRLYMIKVIPEHGVPYYLVDDRGDGNMVRYNTLDTGVRPPMWVIKEF